MRLSSSVIDSMIETKPLSEVLKIVIAAEDLPEADAPLLKAEEPTKRPGK